MKISAVNKLAAQSPRTGKLNLRIGFFFIFLGAPQHVDSVFLGVFKSNRF